MAAGSDAARALEAAGIARGRWGEGRMARLTGAEREFYRWILRTFAAGAPPSVEALCDTASEFDLDVEEALATLAREDLVHHDPRSGNVVVAYPFSGRPTSHRVRIGAATEVHAMCAIDALGIPFMVGTGAEVASLDPVTGEEVWVRIEPDDGSCGNRRKHASSRERRRARGQAPRRAAGSSTSSRPHRARGTTWVSAPRCTPWCSPFPRRSRRGGSSSATCSRPEDERAVC